MPPRTRKTAETQPPAPSLEDAATDADTSPEAPEQDPGAAGPEVSQPDNASAEDASEQQPTAGDPAPAPIQPPSLTYHWVSVNGDGSEPCRHCPPGAPPAGAGSYGCPHGQWVRVQDAD
jgi:hypothetical protein